MLERELSTRLARIDESSIFKFSGIFLDFVVKDSESAILFTAPILKGLFTTTKSYSSEFNTRGATLHYFIKTGRRRFSITSTRVAHPVGFPIFIGAESGAAALAMDYLILKGERDLWEFLEDLHQIKFRENSSRKRVLDLRLEKQSVRSF